MRYFLFMFIIANICIASPRWSELNVGEKYKLNQNINFNGAKNFKLNKGAKLKLIESADLDMIKVNLQRYEIDNCKKKNKETDLELINNKNNSVGVNLSKGCILEVFIEKKDTNNESFVI